MNVLFATIYFVIGTEFINGIIGEDPYTKWLYCFFFSAQSFTTVGYGAINPVGKLSNFVATLEAFAGLMTFAIATGSLFGRFARAVSKIKYSDNILIAPYDGITGMQFMVANVFDSALVEVEAKVSISWMDTDENGQPIRRFEPIELEIDKISMFPTNWVVNHPINENSLLFGKTLEDIMRLDVEVFILLKGFDEVFSQTIYSRHSYIANQFVWGAKFRKPFGYNEEGRMVMNLDAIGLYDKVQLS